MITNKYNLPKGVVMVAGIDTDIGKTFVTSRIYADSYKSGMNIITHKLVQTGSSGCSSDILAHREAAGIDLLPEDLSGESCGALFSTPASPHLAARLDNKTVDPPAILASIRSLSLNYEYLLCECAGGLFVPLTPDFLQIDLLQQLAAPVILVTSPRLGSINHTLLSLEALKSRGIPLHSLVYNLFGNENPEIVADTEQFLRNWLQKKWPQSHFFKI